MKYETCQVCVAGGGIAGVSAALSARRAGADVLLLEREYLLGGLATLGLIAHYLPLCDGKGHQVSFGIAEELLLLSAGLDAQPDVRASWQARLSETPVPRYRYTFQPNLFALLMEKLLLENGVRIRYGAQVCGVETAGGRIVSLRVQEKDDVSVIRPQAVIDATGDAIVCKAAGAETECYPEGNIPASWYYTAEQGKLKLCPLGAFDDPDAAEEEAHASGTVYEGLDGAEVTDFCLRAHRTILNDFSQRKKLSPSAELATVAAIPQLRMVRRLCGKTVLDTPQDAMPREDSIGLICDWRLRGPVYEIPYSCLYTEELSNLYSAGRCISTAGRMWDQTRVIPACAVTGEAAGLAAANTAGGERCDYSTLRRALSDRGIPLHREQLHF